MQLLQIQCNLQCKQQKLKHFLHASKQLCFLHGSQVLILTVTMNFLVYMYKHRHTTSLASMQEEPTHASNNICAYNSQNINFNPITSITIIMVLLSKHALIKLMLPCKQIFSNIVEQVRPTLYNSDNVSM